MDFLIFFVNSIFWYYGAAPPSNTSKTTISNVLTMNLMTTMYTFTNDSTLLNGGPKGGSIDIYNWLLRTTLLDRHTGFEQDNIDTFNDTCSINGGVSKRFTDLYFRSGLFLLSH